MNKSVAKNVSMYGLGSPKVSSEIYFFGGFVFTLSIKKCVWIKVGYLVADEKWVYM